VGFGLWDVTMTLRTAPLPELPPGHAFILDTSALDGPDEI